MKKPLLILVICFSLLGCNESDYSLKERCSLHLIPTNQRIEKLNESMEIPVFYSLEGLFWSKTEGTCISKVENVLWTEQTMSEEARDVRIEYYDELTGELIYSFSESEEESRVKFETELDLVK